MIFTFAWRYFKSKKTTNVVNIISWISILAIAVGSAALILVLSVFNGFEDLVKSLYADFYTDLKISPSNSKFLTLTENQLQKIRGINGVKQISAIAEEKAVLVNGDMQSIVFLKGVDSNYLYVSGLPKYIYKGRFSLGTTDQPLLVTGAGIENAIGVDPGVDLSPITVYLPNIKSDNSNVLDALNSYNTNVSGSFVLQQEFDNKYVITNIGFVKYMLDMGENQYTALEIATANAAIAEQVKIEIEKELGADYKVQTRYQQNQSLYSIMQIEKWVIYGILSLILVVAAFNMIGSLTMLVLEKQKDIAVIKALGANNNHIQNIFIGSGFILAGAGSFSGILIATIICWLQIKFKLIKLGGGTFIIDYYPVKLILSDYLLVIGTVLAITLVAAWMPARKAARNVFSLKS